MQSPKSAYLASCWQLLFLFPLSPLGWLDQAPSPLKISKPFVDSLSRELYHIKVFGWLRTICRFRISFLASFSCFDLPFASFSSAFLDYSPQLSYLYYNLQIALLASSSPFLFSLSFPNRHSTPPPPTSISNTSYNIENLYHLVHRIAGGVGKNPGWGPQ